MFAAALFMPTELGTPCQHFNYPFVFFKITKSGSQMDKVYLNATIRKYDVITYVDYSAQKPHGKYSF